MAQEPTKVKITKTSLHKVSRLLSYIEFYQTRFVIGLICLFFTGAVALLFPKLLGDLIKSVDSVDSSILKTVGIQIALLLVAQSFFSFFRIYLFAQVAEHLFFNLRKELFSKMVSLPMSFFTQNRVGELQSRLSSDITMVQDTFTITIAELVRQLILLIGGMIMIVFISFKLTLFMLAVFPIIIIGAIIFGRFIRKNTKTVQEAIANANIVVQESLQGIVNVKTFTNEWFEIKRYLENLSSARTLSIKTALYRSFFASFIIFCVFGSIVAIVWYALTLVKNNELSGADMTSFVMYTAFIGASIGGLSEFYAQLQKAIGATERIFELIDTPSEHVQLDASHSKKVYQRLNGDIQITNLSFAYASRPDNEVLKSISLHIEAGQSVAFVGSSGSGKSTLANLVLGLYPIEHGSIEVDGQNINAFDKTDLREHIAYVPQEVILFGGTIRENILYGDFNATEQQLIEAAQQANAYEFIERLPEGFDTIVGERGITLSGGQRQRIAIARAVLKNPSILVLDEATSALDSESERLVQEAIDALMKDRTTLVIAHRLSTIKQVDKIVVIDQGTIKEQGTHQELIALEHGLYSHLSKLQSAYES